MYLRITSPKLAKTAKGIYKKDSDVGWILVFLGVLALIVTFGFDAFSQVSLPGSDESSRLEAAGTLLRIIDTGLFKWGTRIFAGLSIVSAGWALKEQRFGVAIMCVISAILLGSAPNWVKNVFDIGNSDSIFSQNLIVEPQNGNPLQRRLNA